MKASPDEWTPSISDAAVARATGQTWAQWRSDLDAWAGGLDHPALARRLKEERGLSGWWAQMVSGSWEMMTGRRDPHQRACGDGKYQASASKTVKVAPQSVETAFYLPCLSNWGPAGLFTRTSGKPGKSINGQWSEGGRLAIWLTAKDAGKTQISLSHEGLESAQACEHWKSEWRDALARLKTLLEAGESGDT